ncbi:MAG: hormogonium polysaccharide secretion pseudopilin HpsB [Microcoleus sp.]
MNKLLKDNSYWQPILFKGAKTETEFSSQPTESKSGSCAQKLKPQDSGYTIIESLVAMIVVSVLMIAIAPVMAYSVAIRVQARRIELAAMAGRTYVDGLRSGSIKFNDPSIKGFPAKSTQPDLAQQPAPTSKNNLYCVDTDGGGCTSSKDFYVQGAWQNTDTSITGNDPTSKGYQVLVRVYRADGFTGKPMTTTQQSVANSSLGNPQAPLVVMQSQILPTTGEGSAYGALCTRLQGDIQKCRN